jgi:predicted nucleic acid-binding protein
MKMFLVDTSAWILHFDKTSTFDLRDVCPPEERVLCLPVYQEILQGIRDESAFRSMRSIIQAADFVENPLTMGIYDEAIALYRRARQRGLTIRSSVDCLIAACALRHNLVVIHRDRDYEAIGKISELRQRAV